MKISLNLASRPYINRSLLYAVYSAMLAALVLLGALNFYSFLHGRREEVNMRRHIEELQRSNTTETDTAAYSVQEHEALRRRIRIANRILQDDSKRPSAIFDRLEQQLVNGVLLSAVQPDLNKQTVRLAGNAENVEALRRLLERLVASTDYRNVYLLQQTQRTGSAGPEGIDFSIELHLRGAE